MNRTDNRRKLLTASVAGALAAAALPALALTSAPTAQAACEKWSFREGSGQAISQSNGWHVYFGVPQTIDSKTGQPVQEGASALSGVPGSDIFLARYKDELDSDMHGSGSIRISGDNISMKVVWDGKGGNGIRGDYTGTVDANGGANGTTSGGGQTASWFLETPLVHCPAAPPPGPIAQPETQTPATKACPDGTSIKATDPCVPPTDAVHVTFDQGFAQWTVNVNSTAGIPGKCVYTATSPGWSTVTKNFDINAKSAAAPFTVNAPPAFTTWHVVTACTGTWEEGKKIEFGRDIQDCTSDGCTPAVKP
jgi:hypothetical protein